MSIEILAWSGCPSHDDAQLQLTRVLESLGRQREERTVRWIESQDEAQRWKFVGSPTYRVNGQELIAPGTDDQYALGCRVYRKRDGRFSPLPDDADLRDALAQTFLA